jgi:transcription elongation factor Elf1
MPDDSHLDTKYFVTDDIYNCPFCKRRHVSYSGSGHSIFDWTWEKRCHIYFVKCNSCDKTSMHLSFDNLSSPSDWNSFKPKIDIDAHIFYSVPTSFFVLDSRINHVLRDLITEAEGCLKMNFLTGASACTRKAIYELTVLEHAEGDNYDDRIRSLKAKHPEIDPTLFDVLAHIKDMTSDKVHEQSWDKWDSKHLVLFTETLKTILQEIYVVPHERGERTSKIKELLQGVREKQKASDPAPLPPPPTG